MGGTTTDTPTGDARATRSGPNCNKSVLSGVVARRWDTIGADPGGRKHLGSTASQTSRPRGHARDRCGHRRDGLGGCSDDQATTASGRARDRCGHRRDGARRVAATDQATTASAPPAVRPGGAQPQPTRIPRRPRISTQNPRRAPSLPNQRSPNPRPHRHNLSLKLQQPHNRVPNIPRWHLTNLPQRVLG